MSIEKRGGVHVNERSQVNKGKKIKSTADQYAEYHNLDWSMCDSDKVEDISERGKVVVKEE